MKTKKEREEYWKDYGRGILPIDALVYLVRVTDMTPIAFATVVRREVKELAEDVPTIGLALLGPGDEAGKLLASLCGVPSARMMEDARQREEEERGKSQAPPPPPPPKNGKRQAGTDSKDRRGPRGAPALPPVTQHQLLPGVALVQVRNRHSDC